MKKSPATTVPKKPVPHMVLDRQAITLLVNDYLAAYWASRVRHAAEQGAAYERLTRTIERLLLKGGKRIRPYLTILSYQTFGGQDPQTIVPVAAAQELLHLSMLINDDIIDRDDIRYGISNVSGSYKKMYVSNPDRDHQALSAALLAGGLLISEAHAIIFESRLAATDQRMASQMLCSALFAAAGGELLDIEAVQHPIQQTDTLAIMRRKTALSSFVTPLETGARLAGASEKNIEILRDYGDCLGIMFQYSDDLLGVFGDTVHTGKSTRSDLREGKHTALAQQAFRLASTEQRALLGRYFGNAQLNAAQAQQIKDVFESSGARQCIEAQIAELSLRADRLLHSIELPADTLQPLRELVTLVAKRQK